MREVAYGERRLAPPSELPALLIREELLRSADDTGGPRLGSRDIVAVLRRHARLAFCVAAVPVALGAWLAYLEEPLYRATAVVRVADARRVITQGTGEDDADPGLLRVANPILSQLQVLQSRSVLGDVVEREGLRLAPPAGPLPFIPAIGAMPRQLLRDVRVDPASPVDTLQLDFSTGGVVARGLRGSARAAWHAPLRLGGVSFVVDSAPGLRHATLVVVPGGAAIDALRSDMHFTPVPETDVIDVDYATSDPLLAQRVVNRMIGTFQSENGRTAQLKSQLRRQLLERQIRQSDSLLAIASQALSAYRSKSAFFNSDQILGGQQSDLLTLEMNIAELESDRRMYGELLDRLRAADPSRWASGMRVLLAAPDINQDPAIARLYGALEADQNRLDSLSTGAWRRAPTDPEVQQLRERLAATRGELTSAVHGHVALLDARVESLRRLRERTTAPLRTLPSLQAEEARLSKAVSTRESISENLREELQKARMASEVGTGEVEVVDTAAVPYQPVRSLRIAKLGLGLLLGLMLGGGMAFVRELQQPSIRRRDDMERLLQVPGLAVIPKASTASRWLRRLLPFHGGEGQGSGARVDLITLARAPSAGAEAYRLLRANLALSPRDAGLRTIAITSAIQGEGKTFTAANLAVSIAREGLRVLLVDGDLRHGRLHRIFGVPRSPGLVELLEGQTDPTVVRETCVDGLSLLPRGRGTGQPLMSLNGERTRLLLQGIARNADIVVLDTPPILAAADAAILAAMADGVLVVVRAGA
ncbi:MAG TPA: GNVR domain-containing protein, partial [Gemmatimonadaceae bacterium]